MSGGGSKPGERRGGRQKGEPNKLTLARAAEIASIAKRAGMPLAIQHIEDGMHRYISLAAKWQVGATRTVKHKDGTVETVIVEDSSKFEHYFDKGMALADKLAPYQSPKLQSTTITLEPFDLSLLSDAELAFLERLRAKSSAPRLIEGGESQTTH